MRRHCQFTVKRSAKCAVRDSVMDYLCDITNQCFLPSMASVYRQVLPVIRSTFTILVVPNVTPVSCKEYRSGLVRLWRKIAVRINSAPSLNCVLVIATQ